MARAEENPFAYVAFNQRSEVMLAHGPTAAHALLEADRLAPDDAIYIIDAGVEGKRIWSMQLSLFLACQALTCGLVCGFA